MAARDRILLQVLGPVQRRSRVDAILGVLIGARLHQQANRLEIAGIDRVVQGRGVRMKPFRCERARIAAQIQQLRERLRPAVQGGGGKRPLQLVGCGPVRQPGDVAVTPGNAERTVGQIADALERIVRAGARTLCLGGDHLVVLGELRAHAAVHGPLGLVLLDAHADVWDTYVGERYYHGSPFRRALEVGLLDPARSLLAGMRGLVYGPGDAAMPSELGALFEEKK